MSLITKKLAFVFPGQGSQKVGMGKVWADASPAARETFEEADEALGFPLSRLCWEGPEEELNLTANTQPALVAAATAVHRALAVLAPELVPVAMAGHSLGEYSALVAAGSLGFADALRLVRRRGELMQEAVPVGKGAMAAIIGLDADTIAGIAAEATQGDEVCAVANLNGPAQTVIAGDKGAIDRAVGLAKERGARKATLLAVSAPFHSPLMRPAREGMAPLLEATGFRDPRVPVVTNVDAAPATTGAAARDALIRQIDSPVRWVESVLWMEESLGVEAFVEVGPGNVLSGLNRRIVRSARSTGISDPDHLRQLLAEEEKTDVEA
jgi:[acyl-carrier-protein] S-malonyltransferase